MRDRHVKPTGAGNRFLGTGAFPAFIFLYMVTIMASQASGGVPPTVRKTAVSIRGEAFHINGRPTYQGRTWRGMKIEGLLMNARLVQGIFDDLNPQTRDRWIYPDTGRWDPERNTREFLAAMPDWRRCGLLAFTINLQGGSPEGYSQRQPWHNSAITETGDLRPDYMGRLERILNRADDLGMVVILGIFYFGQDERLRDEAAVVRALDNAVDWVLDRGYRNVLIEVNNECNVRYDHAILRPDRVHELIERVKSRTHDGRRLLVGTSYGGGTIPGENVVRASDFLLMHGNGVEDPERIAEMVRQARRVPGYRPMPILFNEDDHFDFDKPRNNMLAAVGEYASWGYFDPGKNDYHNGYQCPPVQWRINTERKLGFFTLLAEMVDAGARPRPPALPKRPTRVPWREWARATPAEAGMRAEPLRELAALVQGNGCVVRYGLMVHSWGDITRPDDLASAAKPVISTLMLMAVHEGKLRSPDAPVAEFVPGLRELNGGKDGAITWRHLGSMTSGYGLVEPPGAAYAYNDYAIALYYDTLVDRVFREDGTEVLRKRLAVPLGFQDALSCDLFGRKEARGRMAISVRDFARFGLAYHRQGVWLGRQVLPRGLVRQALGSIVPSSLPVSSGREASMLPGQRTYGGGLNQTPVGPGCYSFNWWVNGAMPSGVRHVPTGPPDLYFASGLWGRTILLVVPSLDLVVCWNNSPMRSHGMKPEDPETPFNRAVRLAVEACAGDGRR